MATQLNFRNHWRSKLNQWLDSSLYGLSTYATPIAIVLISVFALVNWPAQYEASGTPIAFHVIKDVNARLTPDEARRLLDLEPLSTFQDTELSPAPFWIKFDAAVGQTRSDDVIEFPSRHATEIMCWDAVTSTPLGSADFKTVTGALKRIKSGFALSLTPPRHVESVICKTAAIGPARLSAVSWNSSALARSAQEFSRKSGLLDGGIIVLALFVLITAAINKKHLYLQFAVWLLVNLRMGSHSAGWDTQWLGNVVPIEWLMVVRPLTLALYYVITITMFQALFQEDLKKVGASWLIRVALWSCPAVLLMATVMPYSTFLPVLWICTGINSGILVFVLTRILQKTRSRVAMWYSASITVTLFSSLYEVLSAALGLKGLIGSINFVTAALSSSLLAALAIAEHMRQEHEQRLSLQDELTHTYDAMPIGLFTLDLNGRFLSANPALVQMLGPQVLTDGDDTWARHFSSKDWGQLHQMVSAREQDEMEINGRKIPGFLDTKRFLVKATLARGKIEGSLQDVTEKSRATEHLFFLANHDSLTRAYNRRGIETILTSAIGELRSGKKTLVAVAYLDLDRFKLINDLFGHDAGDEVLRQVCDRVSPLLDDGVSVGRVGGDEFVIVFPGVPIAEATAICKNIVETIGTLPYRVGDKAFYVRGSIGLVEVSAEMKFNDVMSSTDRACREAKATNGGALIVYERHSAAFLKHEAELKLIALLSSPSATEGLHLEMQPIMSLSAPHQSLNFEVLLRMRDPLGHAVRTDLLIQAAENCGRMSMIDRWVLTTTIQWLETHFSQMKHTRFVCVNLSGASLNDEAFLHDVYALFESKPDLVRYLCIEITESVALHDLANTRRFVDRIRGYGAKVALDDFGAGYTSFSYLKEFAADLLKIDGSFIVNMNQHPANIAIVEAIVSLAKNLGMKVVAEWAEDLATLKTLSDIGVDYVQGFIVARPQHPDQLRQARSSASFVNDAMVSEFLTHLDKLNTRGLASEPFAPATDTRLH
jgi:diguanylate cyclase (GGDEF)-like protein